MASRKVKHARMMEKRAKWEDEVKERGLQFLKADQSRRAAEKKEAEQKRLDRAKAKSKKMAKEHRRSKAREQQGVKEYKPAPVRSLPRPEYDSGVA